MVNVCNKVVVYEDEGYKKVYEESVKQRVANVIHDKPLITAIASGFVIAITYKYRQYLFSK